MILLFESPTLESYLLRESLKYMQLESGLITLVLELKFSVFGKLLVLCWLSSLWKLLSFYQLQLHLSLAIHLISIVTNNYTIIVKVVRLKRFIEKEVIAINRVRISLQVIFMLDLVKWVSNVVRSYYRKGKKDSN